ncbi:MAG TPA: GatB/YqeY domain-containing protein [Candidatus Kapabacteria bacterium]|nr:GatB/YqeY domain-containing protein [Candidatus Kapabacteria bacterium]
MSLRDSIRQAQTQAMKDRNAEVTDMLRMLWSQIRNEEIAQQHDVTDEDIVQIVSRQVKQLQDALQDFTKGGRTDLIEKTNKEIAFLQQYLPVQLSDEELETIVKEVIAASGAASGNDTGKVMGTVMKQVKGKADGNRVREMVTRLLS